MGIKFLQIIIIIPLFCAILFSQQTTKVRIFEFELKSNDLDDHTLKSHLQNEIINELKKTTNANLLDIKIVESEIHSQIADKRAYGRSGNIRFLIEASISEFMSKNLTVDITLIDFSKSEQENVVFKRSRTLMKENKNLLYWFDKVAKNISAMVDGKPIKDAIFTYCFEVLSEDDTTSQLKINMPIELATLLEDKGFGRDYILKTFETIDDLKAECGGNVHNVDKNAYEYLIKGKISTRPENQEYVVDVEKVKIDPEGKEILIKGFSERYSDKFFENLADSIINQWKKTD